MKKRRSRFKGPFFPNDKGRFVTNPRLTEYQDLLLQAILAGYTTRDNLAEALSLSPHTVRSHLSHIYDRIDGGSIGDIILWAWRNGYELPEATDDDLCGG